MCTEMEMFKIGDSVSEPIWKSFNWKISEIYFSRGKQRARLVTKVGEYNQMEAFKGLVKKDRLCYCSCFLQDLKHKT